jgi:hypothetical protein
MTYFIGVTLSKQDLEKLFYKIKARCQPANAK